LAVAAGGTYVVSYRAPKGQYAADLNAFAQAMTVGPLTVPASGAVYTYGTGFRATALRTTTGWMCCSVLTCR